MMAFLTLLRSVGVRMLLLVALAACSTDKPQTKAPDVALRGLYDSETELVAIFEHVCIGTAPDFVEAPQRLGALGFHKLLGEDFFVSGDDNPYLRELVVITRDEEILAQQFMKAKCAKALRCLDKIRRGSDADMFEDRNELGF